MVKKLGYEGNWQGTHFKKRLPKYENVAKVRFASMLVCKFEIRYKLIIIDFGRWFRSYAETLYKSCVVTGVQEPKD